MELKSLGYKTDLIFAKFDGNIVKRDSYWVVKTPVNPNFFWGNFLIFDQPPKPGDFKKWIELFKAEFDDPRIYHQTFGWDGSKGEKGDIEAFVNGGFNVEESVVLVTEKDQIRLPKICSKPLEIRPIMGDHEWEDAVQIQIRASDVNRLRTDQWEGFYRNQMKRYRRMVEAKLGHWFGAFMDGKMVAGLGIFSEGVLGRYQQVSTDPKYQRLGVCGTLVYESAVFAFREMGLKKLVMIADENYHAARIYESVGFVPTEKMLGLCWWDKSR